MTPANVSVTKKAAPFVLVMPLYEMNPNGTFTPTKLPEVHVYPKNETVTDTKEVVSFDGLDLITEDGTVYRNVEIGQKIPFKLTLNIPKDIAEVESYSVTDTPTLDWLMLMEHFKLKVYKLVTIHSQLMTMVDLQLN